jgi:NAD(P)-dependent dehydrogenase (short-subunit alcohol dehydrogenase family)
MSERPLLLITGIAEGLGAATAREFAEAGYDVLGIARSDRATRAVAGEVAQRGGLYTHVTCDVTHPADLAAALGPHADRVSVLVHNAQRLLISPFDQITVDDFEQVWRVNCLGAFAAAQLVVPHMAARRSGAVILSGATAGLRGGAKFSAFASAKFAVRGLAQALAREYGPRGVHVAHVVLDGLIDAAQSDRRFGPASSPRMDAAAIAQAYLQLATQHPSAWTQELDLRPYSERF